MTLAHLSVKGQIYVERCTDNETVPNADKTQTATRNTYRREYKRADVDLVRNRGFGPTWLCFVVSSKRERRKGRNICRLSVLFPRSILYKTRSYLDSIPRTLHIEDNTSKQDYSKDDASHQKCRGCLVRTTCIQAVTNNLPNLGLSRILSITIAELKLRVSMVVVFRKRTPIFQGQTPSSECRPEQTRQQ